MGQEWGPESLLLTSFPGYLMIGPWSNAGETLILRTLQAGNGNKWNLFPNSWRCNWMVHIMLSRSSWSHYMEDRGRAILFSFPCLSPEVKHNCKICLFFCLFLVLCLNQINGENFFKITNGCISDFKLFTTQDIFEQSVSMLMNFLYPAHFGVDSKCVF